MSISREILCTACGEETLVRIEPVYDGFQKTGEQFVCTACGHVYENEEAVPFKQAATVSVFGDEDRSARIEVFEGDAIRNCRRCRHYVVNPFIQRCAKHERQVQATDVCDTFEEKPADEEEDG